MYRYYYYDSGNNNNEYRMNIRHVTVKNSYVYWQLHMAELVLQYLVRQLRSVLQ